MAKLVNIYIKEFNSNTPRQVIELMKGQPGISLFREIEEFDYYNLKQLEVKGYFEIHEYTTDPHFQALKDSFLNGNQDKRFRKEESKAIQEESKTITQKEANILEITRMANEALKEAENKLKNKEVNIKTPTPKINSKEIEDLIKIGMSEEVLKLSNQKPLREATQEEILRKQDEIIRQANLNQYKTEEEMNPNNQNNIEIVDMTYEQPYADINGHNIEYTTKAEENQENNHQHENIYHNNKPDEILHEENVVEEDGNTEEPTKDEEVLLLEEFIETTLNTRLTAKGLTREDASEKFLQKEIDQIIEDINNGVLQLPEIKKEPEIIDDTFENVEVGNIELNETVKEQPKQEQEDLFDWIPEEKEIPKNQEIQEEDRILATPEPQEENNSNEENSEVDKNSERLQEFISEELYKRLEVMGITVEDVSQNFIDQTIDAIIDDIQNGFVRFTDEVENEPTVEPEEPVVEETVNEIVEEEKQIKLERKIEEYKRMRIEQELVLIGLTINDVSQTYINKLMEKIEKEIPEFLTNEQQTIPQEKEKEELLVKDIKEEIPQTAEEQEEVITEEMLEKRRLYEKNRKILAEATGEEYTPTYDENGHIINKKETLSNTNIELTNEDVEEKISHVKTEKDLKQFVSELVGDVGEDTEDPMEAFLKEYNKHLEESESTKKTSTSEKAKEETLSKIVARRSKEKEAKYKNSLDISGDEIFIPTSDPRVYSTASIVRKAGSLDCHEREGKGQVIKRRYKK